MVRLYVDLGQVVDRGELKTVRADQLVTVAQPAFPPYSLDANEVVWFSAYEVGQRVTGKLDDVLDSEIDTRVPHVFIAGDACHTLSAKAGQGMNVSTQDAFNLGWKLAAVIEHRSPPLCCTPIRLNGGLSRKNLIDFDSEWSAVIAQPIRGREYAESGGVSRVSSRPPS